MYGNMDIPRLKPLAVFTGGQQNWDFLLVEHFGQDGAGLDVWQRTEVGLCGLRCGFLRNRDWICCGPSASGQSAL